MRVMMDYLFTQDLRAKSYLTDTTFLTTQWQQTGQLFPSYTHTGTPRESYETVISYATALPHLLLSDPDAANILYETKIKAKLYEDGTQSYWEDPQNYYTQNLTWFATALYHEFNQQE